MLHRTLADSNSISQNRNHRLRNSGQEEYERLRPLSYSKSHVILIAFALDTPDSLENVTSKWYEEVRTICGPSIPVILVGCKSDLRDKAMEENGPVGEGGYVTKKEVRLSFLLVVFFLTQCYETQAEAVAAQISARSYMECSALLNEGVDAIFESATRAALLVRSDVDSSSKAAAKKSPLGGLQEKEEQAGCAKGCVIL